MVVAQSSAAHVLVLDSKTVDKVPCCLSLFLSLSQSEKKRRNTFPAVIVPNVFQIKATSHSCLPVAVGCVGATQQK